MTTVGRGAIEKYKRVSEKLADSALLAQLRALFDRNYTLVELLDWLHEKVNWDDGEIERRNEPLEILTYRRGRCGEFSILFTALCLAHGYRARLILDMSDHVWTEVWDRAKNRWMHVDPSEKRIDDPLMYERDWKKNLNEIYAFENGKVEEVTKNYKIQNDSLG